MPTSAPSRSLITAAGVAAASALLSRRSRSRAVSGVLKLGAGVAVAVAANEAAGKPVPFLRWSFLRLMAGMKHLTTEWQVGDGREEALAVHVEQNARRGDLDDVIRTIDDFARHQAFLINVGDEKGEILDAAVRSAAPKLVLELGTYVGYGALRLARAAGPDAKVFSVEFSPANAAIARRVIAHAGAAGRVTVVDGTLGDPAVVAKLSTEHGFTAGALDFAFLDHAKEAYLPDLTTIEAQGWLHPGSVVVADNVKFPGAPEYRAHMQEHEGRTWKTQEHETHAEYQSVIKDLVLESVYL